MLRRSDSPGWLAMALLAPLAGCGSPQGGNDPEPQPISIEDARAHSSGETVTLEGHVTVQPGAFVSAMGDEGFALQDDSAGIYIQVAERASFGLGAHVRVTGVLAEQNQLRILAAESADIELLAGVEELEPRLVATGDVDEAVEGQLIVAEGAISQELEDDQPYGYKLYFDDGSGEVQIFVHASTDIAESTLASLAVGGAVRVVGFAAQYEATYEVAPRLAADLSFITGS